MCILCLELSRKGQSTSSLRRHLRMVHRLKDFEEKTIKSTKKNHLITGLSTDAKRKLHALALNAIIEDGRSFNDLNKPGILKLFNSLSNSKFRSSSISLIDLIFRLSSTTPKYNQTKFKTIEPSSSKENDDKPE